MTYEWKEGLENFEGTLYFLKESIDLNHKLVKTQWPNVENLVKSCIYRRNFFGGSLKSLESSKYGAEGLRRVGYTGRHRPATYSIDQKNLPSHNPEIDHAIITTGSTTTKPVVQQMETFIACGVKTSMVTFTTPEMLEERRKKEHIPSAWDFFKKQKGFEKQVIYLYQRDPKERENPLFAPMNSEFENNSKLTWTAMADCIKEYHSLYEDSGMIPLKTVSDTMLSCEDYLTHELIPCSQKYQDRIYNSIQAIKNSQDIRLVASGPNTMGRNSFMIRLENCGFNGREKTVDVINSESYGREGSSDIDVNTLVIGISADGKDVFTQMIMEEAKKKKAKQRIFIGNPYSEMAKYATEVIPIPWSIHGYNGVFGGFGYLGIEFVLDSMISQIAKELGITEEDMRREHSQHG
jgi:hypothetical protein